MRKQYLCIPVLLLFVAVLCAATVWASGLTISNYGEVLVENLQIGGRYSMTQLVNLPLEVANQSDEPIQVALSVLVPPPKNLKKGFELIPDPGWVKLGQSEVDIPARGTIKTDVVISIPDKKEYLGRKFQVNIEAKTKPSVTSMVNIALAVQGRLLFSISPVKQAGSVATERNVHLDFTFQPGRIVMHDVPLGKKVAVMTPEQMPVQIKNSSREKIALTFSSLDPNQTIASVDEGFTAAPNPEFLTFVSNTLTLAPGAMGPMPAELNIPDEPQFKGKNFEFIVSANTGDTTVGNRYLRILVTTKK